MIIEDRHAALCRVALEKLSGEMDYLHAFNEGQKSAFPNAPTVTTCVLEENIRLLESMFKED